MAAAARDRVVKMEVLATDIRPVAASTKLYKGWVTTYDTGGDLVEAANTTNYEFGGVTLEQVDNSSGADGDKFVRVATKGYLVIEGDATLASLAGLGTIAYASDGDTVTNTAGNGVKIGLVDAFENVGHPEGTSNAVRIAFGFGHGTETT